MLDKGLFWYINQDSKALQRVGDCLCPEHRNDTFPDEIQAYRDEEDNTLKMEGFQCCAEDGCESAIVGGVWTSHQEREDAAPTPED